LILGYKNLLISIRTATILIPPTSFLQLILASLSDPAAPNSKIKQTLLHKKK
jgi:ABC-type enterochelin transport system permease subunit